MSISSAQRQAGPYTGPGSWQPWEVAGYLHAGVPQRVMRAVLGAWPHPGDYERAWAGGARELAGLALPAPQPALSGLPRGLFVALAGGPDYPAALLGTPAAPLALFGRGDPDAAARAGLAIVGSRDVSAYGAAVARTGAQAAVDACAAVFSGGASGVDELAHRDALAAGGRTVAVVATGADASTPLLEAVVAGGGCVLSEHPFGTTAAHGPDGRSAPAYAARLVARNRLIVGMSVATLAAEARPGSGTLHSIWATLALGRPLLVALARPGSQPGPGASVPQVLAEDRARTAAQLHAMGAPLALAEVLAGRAPLASGVARDRSELAQLVATAVLLSPLTR